MGVLHPLIYLGRVVHGCIDSNGRDQLR